MEIITTKVRKSVKKRSEFPKGPEKSVYGSSRGQAPYYDPHDNHVHVWTYGTLVNGPQNQKNRFCLGNPKSFTGRYCKVCHEVKYPFYQTSDISALRGDPYYVRNLREAMRMLRDKQSDNYGVLISKMEKLFVGSERFFDFNKESKLFELLTLEGAECKVYKYPGTYIIDKVLENGTVDVSNETTKLNVRETFVNPIYNISKYAPIPEPPRFVEKPKPNGESEGRKWKQRWETYKRWKVLQENLKIFISETNTIFTKHLDRNIDSAIESAMDIIHEEIRNDNFQNTKDSGCVCKFSTSICSCWRLSVNLENCNFLIRSVDRVTKNYVTVADN